MFYIKELLQQVFPNPENITSGKEPILRENISRNDKFLEGFVRWRDSKAAKELFPMPEGVGGVENPPDQVEQAEADLENVS